MSKLEEKELSPKNPYYIPRERKKELQWFCRQYGYFCNGAELLIEIPNATPDITKEKVDTSDISDKTAELAVKRAFYYKLKNIIDTCLDEATKEDYDDLDIWHALKAGVTMGIGRERVCARYGVDETVYRRVYQKFFWLLDKVRG